MKFDAVADMAGADLRARWTRMRRWLEDDGSYSAVAETRQTPVAAVSEKDVEILEQYGIVEEIPAEKVRGGVKIFAVAEPAKERRRPIKHTEAVNLAYGKESLEGVKFPTKAEILASVHKGSHMAAFDFSAYYDSLEYSEQVSSRFCFRKGKKTYRLRVLGMGQRQACEIAQTATDCITDFEHAAPVSMSIIDNVVFVGSDTQCSADARQFFHRCDLANVTLNDVKTEEEAAAATTTSGDWCGVHLDFTEKTACLAAKATAKTHFSWENRANWTYRQFAAHIGLLFWAVGIIDIPVHRFYSLLHFVSEVGRRMQANPDRWDEPMEVWPCAQPALEEWTRLVLENKPRPVPKKMAADLLVITDASAWGWGFIAFDILTGAVHHHGERWRPAFVARYGAHSLQQSVFTEPHAIVNTMCRLLRKDQPRTVKIGTDNSPSEASFRRGFNSHSFNLNECVSRLKTLFPDHDFEWVFVPGVVNPADAKSRGRELDSGMDVEGTLRGLLGCPAQPGAVPT